MLGLSQERFAEAVGVDRSTVLRWERGETSPQPWHRHRLAEVLQVTPPELADLFCEDRSSHGTPDERLEHALRRPVSADLVVAAHLREQVQTLDAQYEFLPSTSLLAPTSQVHGRAVLLRQHARRSLVRRELWTAEMESSLLMGQLVWDGSQRRDHTAAVRYFDQAIAAANQVRDVVTAAHAKLRKSYVDLYGTKNPAAGLALAQQAAAGSRHESHVVTGLALLHVAEAHAMLGDASACDAALSHAEAEVDAIEADDVAAVLHCPSQASRLAGSCFLRLGRLAKAEAALTETSRILHRAKKATAIVHGNLALAGIRQGKVDEAVGHMHDAIDVIEQTRSGGGLNVVFSVARELRPWRDEAVVVEMHDRLLTLMAAT